MLNTSVRIVFITILMYFSANTMHEIKYEIGMKDCLPFHSSIFQTEISVPFHFPYHALTERLSNLNIKQKAKT